VTLLPAEIVFAKDDCCNGRAEILQKPNRNRTIENGDFAVFEQP